MKDRILKVIREHPDGLTISDIAKEVSSTRLTVRRYLNEQIIPEKLARIRRVGVAKLIIPVSDKNASRE